MSTSTTSNPAPAPAPTPAPAPAPAPAAAVAVAPRTRYLTVPRTTAKVATLVTTRGWERHLQSKADQVKLQKAATEGMSNKFKLMSLTDNEKQLDVVYDLGVRVRAVKEHMEQYDMLSVMTVVTPNPVDPNQPPLNEEDLFDKYAEIPLSQVRDFVRFINEYGHPWDQDNLAWTRAFLQDSCEPTLQAKIAEQLYGLEPEEIGGPTYFSIMMNVITSLSEEAVRSMTEEIRTMKISERGQGENITQVVSLLRGAIGRLRNLNKVPQDLLAQLVRLFQTTSVPQFNRLFENAGANIKMRLGNITVESLLQLAEDSYNEAVACKEWNTTSGGKGSSFVANNKKDNKKNKDNKGPLTCWNCGQQGHKSNACPHPKKPQSNSPNNQPAQSPANNGDGTDWHLIPPGNREPHQKVVNNKTFYWCGDPCRRWNLTHKTAQHEKGRGRKANQGGNVPQANNAESPNETPPARNGPRVSFAESIQSAVHYIPRS